MANPNPKPPPKHSRWKKGQSGNPAGGRAHNPALRALKNLTVETFREVVELVLTSNVAEIKRIAEDPNTPGVKVGVCVAFLKAIKSGDYHIIRAIAAELIGKLPDQVNVNANVNAAVDASIRVIDKQKLREAMDELEKEV